MPTPTLYFETKDELPAFGDVMMAIDGFEALDYNTKGFNWMQSKSPVYPNFRYEYTDVVVGSVQAMQRHFQSVGRLPDPIDYPACLGKDITGRHVERMVLERVPQVFHLDKQELFIKPARTKQQGFEAKVYGRKDIERLITEYGADTWVYVSEPMEIRAEFRVFVHNGAIVDIRRYAGSWRSSTPPIFWIERLIAAYHDAPVAYTVDVAMLNHQGVKLVEINDFWAIGAYGLDPVLYATMLRDRYRQIRGW